MQGKGFTVVKPKMESGHNIGKVVDKYNDMFLEKGWKVMESVYRHLERKGEAEAICIEKN